MDIISTTLYWGGYQFIVEKISSDNPWNMDVLLITLSLHVIIKIPKDFYFPIIIIPIYWILTFGF
jgi:hypothetical protein